MGDQSRKLKNPLLTAAGQGFPFDDFNVNTLLIPPPISQPVCDEQHDNQRQGDNPAILHHPAEISLQPEVNENSREVSQSADPPPPQQTGYFTSILSSLPNLSLSSIKGQQPAPLTQPEVDDRLLVNNPLSNFPPQEHHQVVYGNQSRPPLQQPLAPPPAPSTLPPTGGTVSYRLGNQRRLKYATPPNLTSTTSKPFVPSTGVYEPPSQWQSSSFFNPNAVHLPEETAPARLPISAASVPQEIKASVPRDPVASYNTPADFFTPQYRPPEQHEPVQFVPTSLEPKLNVENVQSDLATSEPKSNPEDLAEIDLSQRLSPLDNFQPDEPAPLASLTPQTLVPDFTSNNLIHIKSEPNLSSFFGDKNLQTNTKSALSGSQSDQPLSQISFYNPTEFGPNTAVQNLATQCEINTENVISGFTSSSTNSGNWSTPRATLITSEMPEPTGTATLNPIQTSINPLIIRNTPVDTIPPSLHSLASNANKKMQYRPVYHHWFYRRNIENKIIWNPFSMQDSLNLESVHNSSDITPETKVPTDGGRYDVEILKRQRVPVYWSGEPTEVRRSSWFYKAPSDSKYTPYEESTAARLEEEYRQACLTEHWNRKIELNNGEYIVFHSATIQIHYLQASSPELVASWGNTAASENNSTYLQGASSRPKVVKRGVDEFHIEEGEPEKIDHLLFLVHGIGSVCDLKFRTVEEVVDEFRSISLQLIQSHYRTASTHGIVNRIEVLPISWHATLHSDDTGIDKKLKAITLESIPKLRHFANDTLLDVLFYTSPIYCQTIMQTVGNEMNRLYALFRERNPEFTGNVCLGGHSLGSLILFDLLCHQKAADELQEKSDATTINEEDETSDEEKESAISSTIKPMPRSVLKRRLSRKISYVMGAAGTGQPFIVYPHLNFSPKAFFALGSPIGMFVTVRGIDKLGENFKLPTCPAFFNIFHPFDPVAYRMESLINSEAHKYRPMLIPHHKGRKRMHLELKETMARVGADLKQKLLDSVRSTWNSVYQLAMFHRSDNQALEQEIDKVVEEQLQKSSNNNNADHENDDDRENEKGAHLKVGQLNGGRRIDYVLQEAPFEYINEYIFALTSHVCYWESEDTMLLILKEMYGISGIQADAQLPQQTMSIDRTSSTTPSSLSPPDISGVSAGVSGAGTPQMGIDPTAPICNKPVGPPPTSGFIRKS